jgi:MFS transporter, DHA2 family, multidrug resistance protein
VDTHVHGRGILFIPITTASYAGLKGNDTNQAAALINIARNLGGSIGVALVQTSLQQRQQFRQSRLVEHTLPSDIFCRNLFNEPPSISKAVARSPSMRRARPTRY